MAASRHPQGMMRLRGILALAGVLALGCDTKDPDDEAGNGEETGDGDGDGDGDSPASCLEYADAEACGAHGCHWVTAMRITTAEPDCAVEQREQCIPPNSDGGDPGCVFSIPGCPELVEGGGPGPYQPAWIVHPDGGWVVIDLCGNLEYDSFTKCESGVGDLQPVCNCACAI